MCPSVSPPSPASPAMYDLGHIRHSSRYYGVPRLWPANGADYAYKPEAG